MIDPTAFNFIQNPAAIAITGAVASYQNQSVIPAPAPAFLGVSYNTWLYIILAALGLAAVYFLVIK